MRIEKRKLKDGSTRYKAIIRRKGSPLKTKTFGTRKQAFRWATRLESKVLDGRQLPTRAEERRTVDDLIRQYKRDVLPQFDAKTQRKRAGHLDWWAAQLGSCSLMEFRRAMVNEALRSLARGQSPSGTKASPATQNRYLATLRHAFSYGLKELEWISEHPLSRMGKREPRGRVRFLSTDESERLLAECKKSSEPRLHLLVLLALSNGARQGELLALRWGDVDWQRQVAVVQDSKNRERRALPIKGPALQLLRECSKLRRVDTDLIFADQAGRTSFPRKAWEAALSAAEIEDFRFHDLRHSAASFLAMSGATLAELAEVLGHRTLAMVKRYSHLTEQHTSEVVRRMNERFIGSA